MGLISRVSSRTYRTHKKMQIFIKEDGNTQTVEVENDVTISELRTALESEDCRLLSNGQDLTEEEKTLEDYGIKSESTIEVVHRVLGGGRKRKKKVYTTPKKIKHKRKKVKLATLKYYKVTDTGKLERKRKECPVCGAGIFMSNHKDRQYCGRCG